MSTIFGGDTGLSYEDVQRRRKIADSLRQQYSTMPRNVGEGINAIAKALVARGVDRQASAADERLRAQSEQVWGSLFGGNPYTGNAAPETDVVPMGTPTPVSTGSLDANPGAAAIRAGLIERGLPEHVADGFLLNFRDESAFNTDLNEREPLVPGSRGGYGLAQWTGPRRVALETFAEMRGKPASDLDVQLDFLMTELSGDEARAAERIYRTQSPGDAAAAIATHFLRPAKVHLDRRVAEYTGGGQPVASTRGTPAPSGNGGLGGNLQGIVAALSDPYIRQDPGKVAVLQALLQREMAPRDPVRGVVFDGNLVNPITGDIIAAGGENDRDTQFVDGIGLIDMATGEVIRDYEQPPEDLSESEARMTLFKSMQDETAPILNDIEKVYDPSNLTDAAARNTPIAGRFFESEQGKIYKSAAAAWVEGALRLATGAAATPEEFERTMGTYFAQPGDTPAVIAFKSQLREAYSRTIRRALNEQNVEGALNVPKPADFANTSAPNSEPNDSRPDDTMSDDEFLKSLGLQ